MIFFKTSLLINPGKYVNIYFYSDTDKIKINIIYLTNIFQISAERLEQEKNKNAKNNENIEILEKHIKLIGSIFSEYNKRYLSLYKNSKTPFSLFMLSSNEMDFQKIITLEKMTRQYLPDLYSITHEDFQEKLRGIEKKSIKILGLTKEYDTESINTNYYSRMTAFAKAEEQLSSIILTRRIIEFGSERLYNMRKDDLNENKKILEQAFKNIQFITKYKKSTLNKTNTLESQI